MSPHPLPRLIRSNQMGTHANYDPSLSLTQFPLSHPNGVQINSRSLPR
jgi:hypothetical protein